MALTSWQSAVFPPMKHLSWGIFLNFWPKRSFSLQTKEKKRATTNSHKIDKCYCNVNMWTYCYLLGFTNTLFFLWEPYVRKCVCVYVLGGPPPGVHTLPSASLISYCTHSPLVDFTCKSHAIFFPSEFLRQSTCPKDFFTSHTRFPSLL